MAYAVRAMSTELATRPDAPAYLFDTDDPVAVVEAAARYARPLANVIEAQHLYTVFTDRRGDERKHVNAEGWALLAAMLGVSVRIDRSGPIDNGFEATASAYRGEHLLATADSQCTRDEPNWSHAAGYALRGMAQTRAVSRALRGPLGMVVVLAGYNATPADEMAPEPPEADPFEAEQPRRRRSRAPALRAQVIAEATEAGLTSEGIAELARRVGVEGEATPEQLRYMLKLIAERRAAEVAAEASPEVSPKATEPPADPAEQVAPGQMTIEEGKPTE